MVKVAVVIVCEHPAASPAGNAVDLREGTEADHWHSLGHLTKGLELPLFVVAQAVVNLISDDGNSVLICHFDDLFHVGLRPA